MRFLLFFLVLLVGCSFGAEADRATFDAIAPEYLGYVTQDPALTEEQKERRRQTVRSWEAKVKPEADDRVQTEDAHLGPCDWGVGHCGCAATGCQMPCDGCCGPGQCPLPDPAGR